MNELVSNTATENIHNGRTMIYRIDPIKDPRWPEFLERHPNASIFHSVGWLEALRRTYGYEPIAYTTSSTKQELQNGVLFCIVKSRITGSRLVSLPFSDHCDLLCDSADDLAVLIRFLQVSLDEQHLKYLELRPADGNLSENPIVKSLLPTANFFLHTLSLVPSLSELFHSFDKDCVQRRVQRAERAGLLERQGRSQELLKDFFTLFTLTRSRHNLPPTPLVWFQNLIQALGESVEIRVAYKDETPIAAVLTLKFKGTVYYKYGCSDVRFNKFGAMPWLLWRSIAAARASGATCFDLGRTEEKNVGLLAFKNHFVPLPKPLIYWRYPNGASLDSLYGWKLKLAKRVFACLPNGVLKMIGQFTYRHIG